LEIELPVQEMTSEEIKAYEKDPQFRPSLDFKPTGKQSQPSKQQFHKLKLTQIF
jgi:hypothetical protein